MSRTTELYIATQQANFEQVVNDYEAHDCHATLEDGCLTCEMYFQLFDSAEPNEDLTDGDKYDTIYNKIDNSIQLDKTTTVASELLSREGH